MSARRAELFQLPVAARRAVADHTPRPSTHPRRRRPGVKYKRAVNGFGRAIAAFNRGLDEHFPLVPYRDCLGRSRVAGRARRRRALLALQALLGMQRRLRSGIIYAGYVKLGREMHCSRSTAYRAMKDLRGADVLDCQSGGGRTYTELDQLVDAANGYQVAAQHCGPDQRAPRKPRAGKPAAVNPNSPAQRMAARYLDRGPPARGQP